MNRRIVWVVSGVVAAILLVVLIGNYIYQQSLWHGSLIKPPLPAPSISLEDQNGKPFKLEEYRGKVVLVFFGYTFCPDICPATMAELRAARQQLSAQQAARVQVVLITVDPQRDSPAKIQEYAAGFDPSFIGLSGTEARLSTVWKSYGVYREVQPSANGGYTLAHTSRVYVIYPDGTLGMSFPFGTNPDYVAIDLKRILRNYK